MTCVCCNRGIGQVLCWRW